MPHPILARRRCPQLLFADAAAVDHGAAIAAKLTSWWSLDEASGTRHDSHGTNHLTDNNTVGQAAGKVSTAALFDSASTEYLSRASNATLATGDITFAFFGWLYPTTGGDRAIATKMMGSTYEYEILRLSTTRLGAFINGTPCYPVSADLVMAQDAWSFFYFHFDATANEIVLQVNDNTAVTTAFATAGVSTLGPVTIGANYYNGALAELMEGRLDEVAFLKDKLTTAERTWLYNSGSGRGYGDL